jgi:DNA-binding MarR family transcriptional regulator
MPKQSQASDLEDHLGYWLRYVSNHVSHSFAQRVEKKGVTVAEWALMREMLSLGPANPSQLAERLGMTRGAISKLIDRLTQKNLGARTSAGGDRRFQTVELTSAGKRLVPTLAKLADENDREFFGHLTRQQKAEIAEVLKEIVRRHGWKDIPVS